MARTLLVIAYYTIPEVVEEAIKIKANSIKNFRHYRERENKKYYFRVDKLAIYELIAIFKKEIMFVIV